MKNEFDRKPLKAGPHSEKPLLWSNLSQHVSLLVIADVYEALEFNASAVSNVSFQKGEILQSKQTSVTDVFTAVSGTRAWCVFLSVSGYRRTLFEVLKVYVSGQLELCDRFFLQHKRVTLYDFAGLV